MAVSWQSDNNLEQAVAAAWQEVFQRDGIGFDENFFELGGNSLLAMDLVEGLAARIDIEIPVLTLFRNPTIHELAAVIASDYSTDPSR